MHDDAQSESGCGVEESCMPGSWREFLLSDFFMPHGHCYLWKPALVWLQVLSNGAIALAYISIFLTLVYLVRRIEDIPFQWMYVAFAIFIVTCGFTHLFDIYVIWKPAYWLDGSLRALTAVASVGTAILLPPLVPKAVALAEAARVSQQRGIKLEETNREMALLLDKTSELDRLKTQFFANVSHELRTPLTLILGPTEKLLRGEGLGEAERHDLELVRRNARTLLKHVNDLLDVSKLEAGKMAPAYRRGDLASLLRLVASNFSGHAAERSLRFEIDAPESLQAEFDADQMQRVVLNLLSNAFKFAPDGGKVRSSLSLLDEGHLRLEVGDSGPGIRPEERESVFERFHQSERGGTPSSGGTGLGLAIARDFALLHGGTLVALEAPEGGALLRMDLPRWAPSGSVVQEESGAHKPLHPEWVDQALRGLAPRPTPASAPVAAIDRPRVLIVEDNPEMRQFISASLQGEYAVETASHGREGLARIAASPPDLVLTDIMMPEMGGDELVRSIRAEVALDSLPVVLLSAKADDELRVALLRSGAQDYLMKPFSIEELKARIRNLITMKRARDLLQRELDSQMNDLEGLAREVTGRKRELESALAAVRVAREQAERASQLKTNFLGMVSHELRTPLTAFQLQLERLQRFREPPLAEAQQEVLKRMVRSAERLAELVDSLLHYTRIESGKLTTETQDLDPLNLALDVLEELRPLAEAKGLSTTLHTVSSPRQVNSDPQILRLILRNLIGNAIKFTERGSVEVFVEADAVELSLRVKDSGPGIPASERTRIFEPFESLEPTRQKHTPGIGLGLALVREMTAALQGRIDVESTPNEGSTFILRLPLAGGAFVSHPEETLHG